MTEQRAKEIKEMIDLYGIRQVGKDKIYISQGRKVRSTPGADEMIIESKPEILDYFRLLHGAEIEGLAEIRAARARSEAWYKSFSKAIENDEVIDARQRQPEDDIQALYKMYPRAAAYLRAEALAYKSNYELSAIGTRAKWSVVFGDYVEAMEIMEQENQDFVDRHIWD